MKLVNAQNRIQELMSRFVAQIEMAAAMSRTDLNKAAETVLMPLLNEVYGWNLENINYA
ncbi:MAG: SMEK domain-containing protein, partial [Leptolyngbyaceae cyanobacterium CAN_BIN12]|nr:SMEK domain-containing protein [Leptolyngbyaceae cyanobacterium CAN_BIN12]